MMDKGGNVFVGHKGGVVGKEFSLRFSINE
jgi:hypothetical protein